MFVLYVLLGKIEKPEDLPNLGCDHLSSSYFLTMSPSIVLTN
jgi:hypothetical protein